MEAIPLQPLIWVVALFFAAMHGFSTGFRP